ncbi:transglycosylase SLT domain-containing protein [Thermodesulfobacteriota bacterium]
MIVGVMLWHSLQVPDPGRGDGTANPHERITAALVRSIKGVAKKPFFLLLFLCLVGALGCSSRVSVVKQTGGAEQDGNTQSASTAENKKSKRGKFTKGRYPQIPIKESNARVRRFIRQYAYQSRPTMRRYLGRGAELLPMAKAIAKEHGLPEDIAYLFMLESGANPSARSSANALGMWQFMPATARSYGLRVDSWVDERLDPERSTHAAMLYLKDLYGMFGCWRLALSAYNSGENKLNRVLCQEDANEYDEICSSKRLKRETREFWPRFQAIASIAKNPTKYGYQEQHLEPYRNKHETVTVQASYSLDTVAKMVGSAPETLRALNPGLLRSMTPPRGPEYALRVPAGKKTLAQGLRKTPAERAKGHIVYVVNRGDSVHRILKHYRVSKSMLQTLNPDVNFRRKLRRGAKIVIPVKKKARDKRPRRSRRVSFLD